MDEGAGDLARDASSVAERRTVGILELKERLAIAFHDDARIVELVAAKALAYSAERPCARDHRLAVAQMQAPPGKARRERQQSRHRMRFALRIGETFAQDHIAAAFTVDRRTARR